jgi:hypothetical protein
MDFQLTNFFGKFYMIFFLSVGYRNCFGCTSVVTED